MVTLGRKNYLFAVLNDITHWAAVIYCFFAMFKKEGSQSPVMAQKPL